jgi:hypothetical protein
MPPRRNGEFGEHTRPACGFRRRAENRVARVLAHGRGLGATPKPARGTRAPRTDDAAPTGLGNFLFGFLQRCRAYGARKTDDAELSWMR